MGHKWGAGFDRSVCEGCPHRIEADEDSGRSLVDAVASAIGIVSGSTSHRCGKCGCFLSGLERTEAPPSDCVRLDQHVDQ